MVSTVTNAPLLTKKSFSQQCYCNECNVKTLCPSLLECEASYSEGTV